MNNFITQAEVFEIAVNRSISSGLIKDTQIIAAEHTFIDEIFNRDFVQALRDNTGNKYDDFIQNYIKPIIAWGVIYNNFDYISLNITDKGIIQMLVEGTANLVGRDSRNDARNEIKNTVFILIKRLIKYCEKQIQNGNTDYLLFEVNDEFIPSAITLISTTRQYQYPF